MNISKALSAMLLASIFVAPAAFAAERAVSTTTTTARSTAYTTVPKFDNVYVGGQIGWNNPEGSAADDTVSFTGVVGQQLTDMFRTDLEVSYRNNDVIGGDVDTWAFLLNGWVDFKNETRFTPYLGGGLGFVASHADATVAGFSFDDEDTAFTYQLGAGLAYALDTRWDLTVDYRYIDTADLSFVGTGGVVSQDDYQAHEVRGGLRYKF